MLNLPLHVYTLTVSRHSLACQSSATSKRPSRWCFPSQICRVSVDQLSPV